MLSNFTPKFIRLSTQIERPQWVESGHPASQIDPKAVLSAEQIMAASGRSNRPLD